MAITRDHSGGERNARLETNVLNAPGLLNLHGRDRDQRLRGLGGWRRFQKKTMKNPLFSARFIDPRYAAGKIEGW
jgi:hypothetical protein